MIKALFKNIRQDILIELNSAKFEIKVAMGWFTNDELFKVLCEKVKTGVTVELIILNDFINNRIGGLNFQYFIDIGGSLYFGKPEHPMHNKTCIIDKQTLINGSYNWTYNAESKNEENVIIHKGDLKLIEDFNLNFDRMKLELVKVEKVIPNTLIDISQFNFFDVSTFLAFDLIEKANFTKNPLFVKKALELIPNNIYVQKAAVEYNLYPKRSTQISISNEIIENKVAIIIPKGTAIPASGSSNFTTTSDDQTSVNRKIRYGENSYASDNRLLKSYTLSGIPKMKAGEATLVLNWEINIKGILTITDVIKQSGDSKKTIININHLITNP